MEGDFMESMIEFIHERIGKKYYDQGIDFTMGNGHDTLFLSDYCKHVYSYDIQAMALNNTKEFIKDKKKDNKEKEGFSCPYGFCS